MSKSSSLRLLLRSLALENADMMLDWNGYRNQLAAGVKEIGQLSPDTIKGYMALSEPSQKTDLLGAKVRELIARAVAVSLRCDGCIVVHTDTAIRQGATREEIADGLSGAATVNAGATARLPLALWMHSRNIRAQRPDHLLLRR